MNNTIQYLKYKFSEYYSSTELLLPERFTRREWGFLFIGESYMQRHLAFKRSAEIKQFLSGNQKYYKDGFQKIRMSNFGGGARIQNVPAHAYYSSAYYKEPGLQPMPAKVEGWLGADLIFDLDDDHLRNIEGLTQQQRLEKVKYILRKKLLDDFILNDFGFDPKYIKIAFSGSRGYHIHVTDTKVFCMSSAERRELVDYLTGTGLDIEKYIIKDKAFDTKHYGDRTYSKIKISTPKLTAPGWKGRMARGILELYNKLYELPDDNAILELSDLCNNLNVNLQKYIKRKITNEEVESLYNEMFSTYREKINQHNFDEHNILEIFSNNRLRGIFVDIVKQLQKIEMAGETDEPVTTDVKRLIRLPTSLHGKTGFKVVPLSMDELVDFDPFRDALAFGEDPIKITFTDNEAFNLNLGGETFKVTPGENELPEFAAVYLICQRKAIIEH